MATIAYLGDEVGAAGYRLAGATVHVPQPGEESTTFATALAESSVVLVSAAVAVRIAEDELRKALAALSPLTLVVPEPVHPEPLPDVAARLRRQLGLEG